MDAFRRLSMHSAWRRRPGSRPLVLGHRGARLRAPENTMAAFELSATEGADGVELDVRLDGSGEVVVLHDRTLARVTQSFVEHEVEMLSSRDLTRIDLGGGERVPRLAEVLDWARARGQRVNVELKADVGHAKLLVARVANLVGSAPDADSLVLLSSFHAGMVFELAHRLRHVPVAWLVSHPNGLARSTLFCRSLGATAIHPAQALLAPTSIGRWRDHGLLVNVWTVNHPDRALELARAGVDGFISDNPGALVAVLGPNH